MKKTMKRISILLTAVLLLAACGKDSSKQANVNEELSGELTVYTAIEEELIPEYTQSFEEQYPNVKLNMVRDSTGIMTAKLLSEGKDTKADVVWGLAASSLLSLDQKGMLEGYTPKGSEKIAKQYKDSNEPAKWVGNTAFMTGIVVNTVELEKRGLEVPKSYSDLAKPEYKDLIVMPHPASSGTGFLTVSGWLQMMGEDKAWSYMNDLHSNVATYTHSGSKPAKLASTGEFPIGVSLVYGGVQQKQMGAPVEVILPEEGLGWEVEANALIKKEGKDQELAKAFLDWAISEEVMKKYYEANGFSTMENDFEKPEGFPKGVEEKMFEDNDFIWASKQRDAILDTWESRFGGKAESNE